MTNLAKIMLFALILGTLGIYLTSCNKSDTSENLIDTVEQTESSTTNLRVEDNTLVFDSFEDYVNTLDYVRTLDRDQLDLWEEGIGFTSSRKLYDMALDELELITEFEKVKSIENKYKNVVKFTEDEIYPLYSSYHMSTLLNKNGIVRIGDGLTKYTEDKMINILDGDINKLATALDNLKEDHKNGIYIQETIVNLVAKSNCPTSRNASKQAGNNPKYRLSTEYKIRNHSQVTSSAEHGVLYWVWYEIETRHRHQRKKKFNAFWRCYRTNVNYAYQYNVAVTTEGFPDFRGIDYISSVSYECDVNKSKDMIRSTFPQTVYHFHSMEYNVLATSTFVTSPKSIYVDNTCD